MKMLPLLYLHALDADKDTNWQNNGDRSTTS
ncbi:hypothetical protein AQUSIP_25610 [Aquicella siphonis]|uniref:Uncharacterized protein n=1 Tax=Aquicella siphonis TaxID=254247 RepID=A0A5E4PJT5_9COXI|nr:hypothetical protein AQUSIP_25610 [Aquicella siphonis]